DRAHLTLLERFLGALGLSREDLIRTVPSPAVDDYLALLRRLFLESHYLVALGAELAVEVTAVSEFKYLYPALRRDPAFQAPDLEFFKLHLAEEESHGDWLVEAVRKTARTEHDQELVRAGARETADGWLRFWTGLHRAVFLHPPPAPAEPGIGAPTATGEKKTAPHRS
ncbi:MAG: iron-containing redox enzyme family protein, partial [Nitrospirales bacterium]